MLPTYFEGAIEIKKPENLTDEQCFSVWAYPIETTQEGINGEIIKGIMWVEAWQPSKEDIEAINAGNPIWIQIHSIGLPPIAIFTFDKDGNSNDAE